MRDPICDLCADVATVVLHIKGIGKVCLDCCELAVRRHVKTISG